MARPIRFVMIGGFLGAGKTTLIGRLARAFQGNGKHVCIVTNDQAAGLVDTQLLQSQGFDVNEVAGSCFCCNFDGLTDAMEEFDSRQRPDVIIAEKSARFAFPELRLGLVPGFGGIPRLERDVGNAVVRDLLMTGRSMNAKRANEVGLVSQVVARGEGLTVARKVAEQAARFDPETTRRAKRFAKPLPVERLRREKDLFIEMMASPVVVKALRKFVESTDVRPYLP